MQLESTGLARIIKGLSDHYQISVLSNNTNDKKAPRGGMSYSVLAICHILIERIWTFKFSAFLKKISLSHIKRPNAESTSNDLR